MPPAPGQSETLTTREQGETLTTREVEILRLLAEGEDALAIADTLTISAKTVRTHLQNVFAKLGATPSSRRW